MRTKFSVGVEETLLPVAATSTDYQPEGAGGGRLGRQVTRLPPRLGHSQLSPAVLKPSLHGLCRHCRDYWGGYHLPSFQASSVARLPLFYSTEPSPESTRGRGQGRLVEQASDNITGLGLIEQGLPGGQQRSPREN